MSASIAENNSRTTYRAGSNAPLNALARVRGETPLPTYTVTSPTSALSWSDNGAGGSFELTGTNNVNAIYTPKNKSQIVTISATDSTNTKNIALNVTATLPLHPQIGYEVEIDVETTIAYARDRTRYSREEGSPEMAWVFAWDNRDNTDQLEMRTFWFDHRRIKQFYVYDVAQNIYNKVWFNSPMKFAPNADDNRWAMSAGVSGYYQGITVLGGDTSAPTAPVQADIVINSSTALTISWAASTDNVGVIGYETRINGGAWINRGNVLSYQYTALTPGTLYTTEVRAYDATGNYSVASNSKSGTTTSGSLTNYALSSNGSTASASAQYNANFDPSRCIDGYKHTNNNWNTASTPGGGWDAGVNPAITPQWLEVNFNTSRTILQLDAITIADSINYTTDPTLADIFTLYGIVDFKFQYWNGSSWVDVAGTTVTANNKVWRQFTGLNLTTTKIRVYITNGLSGDARLVEVQAWG